MTAGYTYRAHARWAYWTSAPRGTVEVNGRLKPIEFSAPPEFHGESGFWTPEHFFVAAVASCFVTTFRAIAGLSKFEPVSFEITVEGTVSKGEGGYEFTEVTLRPEVVVSEERERERALRLLEKAERACLVSRSLKSEIHMEPTVVVGEAELAHP